MQAIIETLFDSIYLTGVMILGLLMIKKSNGNKQYLLFGIMAIVLGLALALCTTGLQDYTFALGIGKFITSITMTIFYIILYYVWRLRYQIQGKNNITIAVYVLAIIRIALCLFPQNAWTSAASSLSWGIYRNIPFTIMGFIIIYLFYNSAKENHDKDFQYMWLTIVISFGFYLPVVLFADIVPMIGMLMIPKTCAYIWTVYIGYHAMKKEHH